MIGPFDIISDHDYPERAQHTRIARQLMVPVQMGLTPPAPGPKTTFLLRRWHSCVTGGASWPEYRLDRSGVHRRDDYGFLRWLFGEPGRTRQVIGAARTHAAAAVSLLAERARQAREHPSQGGQWFHAILRAEQRWYTGLPIPVKLT